MKILSKEQVYEGDRLTAQKQQISSTELMERAATQIFNWIHLRMQGAQVPIHVFCGIGNNGGDGLVLARHLINHGYQVHTYVVNYSDKRSKDFLINYDRIKQTTKEWPTLLDDADELPQINTKDIIVDAVFGIGLNRPADEWVQKLFQHFRDSGAFTLSIDIPSGLYTDQVPKDENSVVWANYTLTFQAPKLVFFLPDTAKYTQEWEVLDIGIDPEYLYQLETEAELIGKYEMLNVYQPREKFSHKGTYGHALIIGGSHGKMGAVTLSSKAALIVGAGLVSAYIPSGGCQILQTAFPEAMVITDAGEQYLTDISFDLQPTVIGMGMGMGTQEQTLETLEAFLKANKQPLVLDADALNLLSQKKTLLKLLPELTVLTPHPKELERLIGSWNHDFEKLDKVKEFSKKYGVVVVIKGANTITFFKDRLYVNTTGNPGLATAGSGDVLTGMITGLIAQGYDPISAAVFGVYLHGKSADIQVENCGYQALLASHVIEGIGKAFLDLFAKPDVPEVVEETSEEN